MISRGKIVKYTERLEALGLSSEEAKDLASALVAMSDKLINTYLESNE